MIGGPADLVVENDVRKVRGPGHRPPRFPASRPRRIRCRSVAAARHRTDASSEADADTAFAEAVRAESSDAARQRTRVRSLTRGQHLLSRAPSPRSSPSAATAPGAMRRAVARRPSGPADEMRASGSARSRSIQGRTSRHCSAQSPRRRNAPVARSEPPRAAPACRRTIAAAGRRNPAARSRSPPPLPAAQVPWAEPDLIENEIVRALRVEPQARSDQAGARASGSLRQGDHRFARRRSATSPTGSRKRWRARSSRRASRGATSRARRLRLRHRRRSGRSAASETSAAAKRAPGEARASPSHRHGPQSFRRPSRRPSRSASRRCPGAPRGSAGDQPELPPPRVRRSARRRDGAAPRRTHERHEGAIAAALSGQREIHSLKGMPSSLVLQRSPGAMGSARGRRCPS